MKRITLDVMEGGQFVRHKVYTFYDEDEDKRIITTERNGESHRTTEAAVLITVEEFVQP